MRQPRRRACAAGFKQLSTQCIQFARRHAAFGGVEHCVKHLGRDQADALERCDIVMGVSDVAGSSGCWRARRAQAVDKQFADKASPRFTLGSTLHLP